MIPKFSLSLFLSLFLFGLFSCDETIDPIDTRMVVLKIVSPKNETQFIEGQEVGVQLDIAEVNDSAQLKILLNGVVVLDQKGVKMDEKHVFENEQILLGYNEIEVVLDGIQGKKHTEKRKIIVFANTEPDIYIPVVKKSYPHNAKHYTQGYEFLGNRLFEGTGQKGESMVAEINLNNGEATRKIENDGSVFGEGITIMNDMIYQLTWQSQVCYVYDIKTLTVNKSFSYDGEGWGLANDGKVIYMSNGSSKIFVRDPKTFDVLRTFDVFSNRQEYRALNELEFVDGYLYANVYQQNYIVKIDPKDGRVVGLIDCNDLLTEGKGSGDVLNGIAYNSLNKHFFITGKYWIKVFEVVLQKKSEV